MKHLVNKEHTGHLKKRAILEIVGFAILISVCINQRSVITTALSAIRQADVFYLGLLLMTYWVLLPIAAQNYRLLSNKPLSLFNTALAHLSGSGPARIIPGGLGQISVGVVYMQRVGLKLQQSIIVIVTNNLIGIVTNLTLLLIALLIHPTILDTIFQNLTGKYLLIFLLFILVILMAIFLLSHARATKKIVKKARIQWGSLLVSLSKDPKKLTFIIIDSITITIGHTLMIILAAKALSIDVSVVDGLIALSAGVFIGGIIPTPGGLGAVEAGTMSALVVLGYNPAEATSIALLFRTANYWQPLIPGMFAYMYLRERKLL
ncbi:MAG: lysylphosphatidylglycerol synthase transmembrane domain-containing protein [Candidatus Saccharibacteria bacterium]|nr:lysylphosphatidylglycerol synthase transmembrane domain-containing protein [Candidatus Saccharibacteria bacterium]